MPLDTHNTTTRSIAWDDRQIPIASPFKYTSVPKEDIARQRNSDKSGMANLCCEESFRTRRRYHMETLLGWLDPRLTQEDFPIAIQFTTHGLRTTVISECAPSLETCGPNPPGITKGLSERAAVAKEARHAFDWKRLSQVFGWEARRSRGLKAPKGIITGKATFAPFQK